MSYGPIRPDVYRAICVQLDRVLKGAEPADLPVEHPTKFELAINLKTAKAVGLKIPASLIAHRDRDAAPGLRPLGRTFLFSSGTPVVIS
jgi:putative ABC transport system substrate-binding protein